jgi:hypothetical protein
MFCDLIQIAFIVYEIAISSIPNEINQKRRNRMDETVFLSFLWIYIGKSPPIPKA